MSPPALDDDMLRRLHPDPARVAPIRPLEEIRGRARTLRRHRLVARVTAVTVLAGGLGAGVYAVRGSGHPDRDSGRVVAAQATPTPTTSGAGTDCSSGYGSAVTFADIPQLLYLPSSSAAGTPIIAPALARDDRSACVPPPIVGSWYTASQGTVTRTLQVFGPGAKDDYLSPGPGGGTAGFAGRIVKAEVEGRPITIYVMDDPGAPAYDTLYWTAADGSNWEATASGMTDSEVLAAVKPLRISSGKLEPGSAPAGTWTTIPLPATRLPAQHDRYFNASFVNGNQDAGGWSVEVRQGSPPAQPFTGSKQVDVNGTVAWWTPPGGGGGLSWTLPNGLVFSVSGTITEAKALEVARSMVHVSPDDPRLVAVRETPSASTS